MESTALAGAGRNPLGVSLEQLAGLVEARPDQTVHRVAESAVMYWTRVLDGKDSVQPRLPASGYLPAAFHFGMETAPDNQLDRREGPLSRENYGEELQRRLEGLRALLQQFFQRTGYRSSSDQCDQTMMELARFSRFLGARCLEVERATGGPDGTPGGRVARVDLVTGEGRETLLYQVRYHLVYWEPFLNDAIVAWQQNALEDFEKALQHSWDAQAAQAEGKEGLPHDVGYPFRAQGRPRLKVSVLHPEFRPMRGKSMFTLRVNQLLKRVAEEPELPLRQLLVLDREVRHFISMVERNHFMLATEPAFQETSRSSTGLIRGKPSIHPFLQDPTDFFKKALLFFNGTYTIAGGGLDPVYLQLRQLERYCKFHHWAASRPVRAPLEACLVAWEENRWRGFAEGILRVAELIRGAEEGA